MLAEEVTSCLPGAKLAAVTREASTGTIYGVPWCLFGELGDLGFRGKFPAFKIYRICRSGFFSTYLLTALKPLGAVGACSPLAAHCAAKVVYREGRVSMGFDKKRVRAWLLGLSETGHGSFYWNAAWQCNGCHERS